MSHPSPDVDKSVIALGQAIREVRKEKGLTQEELAQRVELQVGGISAIESGRRNPTWGVVRGISYALGVRLADLARLAVELERRL